jgi:uncharacterized membrane protein YeiH
MLLVLLDYAGVAVFAATGALAASRKELDLMGFMFLAIVTGIGGGTLRDLVLGALPVFWVIKPTYVIVCASVAVIVYFTAPRFESRYRWLIWLDAVGMSAYCVMGAAKGYVATGSIAVSIVTGVLTATFGGILRDVIAGEPSVLLRPEIYVTAALSGAAVFTLSADYGLPVIAASALGMATALVIRGGALRYGWTLPRYRPRPGRDPDDVM